MSRLKDVEIPVHVDPATCSRCGTNHAWNDVFIIVVHGSTRMLCEECMDKLDRFLSECDENRLTKYSRCPICGKIVKVEQVTERRDIYEC